MQLNIKIYVQITCKRLTNDLIPNPGGIGGSSRLRPLTVFLKHKKKSLHEQ